MYFFSFVQQERIHLRGLNPEIPPNMPMQVGLILNQRLGKERWKLCLVQSPQNWRTTTCSSQKSVTKVYNMYVINVRNSDFLVGYHQAADNNLTV